MEVPIHVLMADWTEKSPSNIMGRVDANILSHRFPSMLDDEKVSDDDCDKTYTLYSDDESGEEKFDGVDKKFNESAELSTILPIPCSCLVIGTEHNFVLHCSYVPKGEAHATFEPPLRNCVYNNFLRSRYKITNLQIRTDGLGKNKNIAAKVIDNLYNYCYDKNTSESKLHSFNNGWMYDMAAWQKYSLAKVCIMH